MEAKSKWLTEDGNIVAPNTMDSCVFGSDGKSLKEKLPFKFGIDENGNYGYIKVGADTVTPFKSGTSDYKQFISGYAEYSNQGNSSANGGEVYAPDGEYPGYGRYTWWTTDNLINAYNAYHFFNPVKVTRARIALGVSTENTWTHEGTLSIQASNDYFSQEAITLATVTLSYDQDLLSKGLYGVFWEGDIDNDQFYNSYRVICTDSSGFTGVNKLQLSCIRYFGEAQI